MGAITLHTLPAKGIDAFGVEGFCQKASALDKLGLKYQTNITRFRLAYNNGTALLRMMTEGSRDDYVEVQATPSQTFYLTVIRGAVEAARASGAVVGENIAGGIVLKRAVPNLSTYDPAGPIWYMFCSFDYLKPFTNANELADLDVLSGAGTDSGLDVEQLRVIRKSALQLLPNGLPLEITSFESGEAKTEPFRDGAYDAIRLPGPYGRGFVGSHFRVTETRSYLDAQMPVQAEAQTYWIRSDGTSTNDLWLKDKYLIVATNFYTLPSSNSLEARLPGKTSITEARFVEAARNPKASFSYFVDERLPSEEEVMRSQHYRDAKAQPKLFERRVHARRATFLFAISFVAILIVPLLLFRRAWAKS